MINYNNSKKEAIEIKEELKKHNYSVEIFKADISKREEVDQMVKFCIETFGDINILINNAGTSQIKPILDVTIEEWFDIINVNLNSVFNVTQEVLKNMIKNKSGCIINITSIWGLVGASCEVPYSTAKAGINGFTKALAKELGPSNIRVNAIAPGDIDTDMNENLTREELSKIKEEIPLGRIGKPADIVKCARWLIEDTYTTGQVISPNGGWVIS